jgi:hypothetical protein
VRIINTGWTCRFCGYTNYFRQQICKFCGNVTYR